jgi:hypothetical protein
MLIGTLLAAAALGGGHFTAHVTNPYFPARPGMRWVYTGVDSGHRLRDVVRVSRHVEMVNGVPCATVRDRVYLNGRLAEDTIDWFSQDARGTVWYFGEATKELDRHGRVKSTEGSWRAGVDGARQGIVMPRRPRAGQVFQQEHFKGHAEDRFKVVSVRRHVVRTREWTPLEPGVIDGKWYRRGVGMIREQSIKGGQDRADLVSFTRTH